MEVVCRGPFRARSFVWQPGPSSYALTVVCKATFVLAPGESPFHVEPADVFVTDVHHDDDPRRSLSRASDFAPMKTRAEVLITGHAHAPDARPVPSLVARVAFQDVDKAIAIVGDSHIALDNTLHGPIPFTKMPLRWERASAGDAGQNPSGVWMGRHARADAWGRVFLPNLRPVSSHLSSRWEVLPPAGFGPIAPDWPSRLARLGRHAQSADPRRLLGQPAPLDLDFGFFNVAPPDQTTDEIQGDEQILLENLIPGAPRFTTRLARISPHAQLDLDSGAHEPIELSCDTLTLDTDSLTATLVWRGQAPLDRPDRKGRVIVSGQALTAAISVPAAAPLPFSPGASPPASEPTPPGEPVSVAKTIGLSGAPSGFVLPFGVGIDTGARPATPATPAPAAPAIPEYATPAPETAPASPVSAEPAAEDEPEPVFQSAYRPTVALAPWMRPPSADSPLPFQPGPAHEPLSAEAPEPPSADPLFSYVPRPQEPEVAPPPPGAPPPEPPPMLAPLWEKPAADEPPPASDDLASSADTIPPEAPPSFEDYPLERCARIAAKLACHPAKEKEILDREHLSPDPWEMLSDHWTSELKKDASRGKQHRIASHDAAYVEALEAERGPLTVQEYARLVVAADRGTDGDLLSELRLPPDSLPRIRRVWIRKTMADSALAREVRAATKAAMEE